MWRIGAVGWKADKWDSRAEGSGGLGGGMGEGKTECKKEWRDERLN